MLTLRDGTCARDPRLDRIRQVDLRTLNYPVAGVLTADQYNAPRSYTWSVPVVLDQGSEGSCFTRDVLIRLADGSHRPIESLRVLDRVATAEGNVGTVLAVMARRYDGPMLKVRLYGHAGLHCTPEHPILTRRGYVAAGDLVDTDLVAVPRFLPPDAPDLLDTSALVDVRGLRGVIDGTVNTGGVLTDVAPLPTLLGLTPDLGRLIGLYAAEGSTSTNKVVWTFGKHEQGLVDDTVALIKSTLGAVARIQPRPNNSTNVVLYGKTWRLLFSQLVPGTARHGDKHLSPHVTNAPREFLEALLDGWLDGDGHHRRRARRSTITGISSCRVLAFDMHAIATALGRRPGITWGDPSLNEYAATRQTRHVVEYAATPKITETRTGYCGCGCGEQTTIARKTYTDRGIQAGDPNRFIRGHTTSTDDTYRCEQDDTHLWRRVLDVTVDETWDDEYVFNLEVEGDHSYIAEGIGVHNCVGHGWAHELAARPGVVQGVDHPFAVDVYHGAQRRDPWVGGSYPGAQPFYEGTSVQAGAEEVRALGFIDEYRWAFSIPDLITAIGYRGPAVIGVDWYAGMFQPDSDGWIRPTGDILGGHCVCLPGVRVVPRAGAPKPTSVDQVMAYLDPLASYVIVHNSWGRGWGVTGRARLSLADLAVLWPGGDFCVPVVRHAGYVPDNYPEGV